MIEYIFQPLVNAKDIKTLISELICVCTKFNMVINELDEEGKKGLLYMIKSILTDKEILDIVTSGKSNLLTKKLKYIQLLK